MTQVVLATHNPAKIKRFQKRVEKEGLQLLAPQELSVPKLEVEESGKDEYENAKLKAQAYFGAANKPAVALDTGFYIENLPTAQQPAKHVQRLAGVDDSTSEEERFRKMTEFYRGIARELGGEARAYFKDVFCLWTTYGEYYTTAYREAVLTDYIYQKDVHFPIASIYKVPEFEKYYHELTEEEMAEYVKPSVIALQELLGNLS